MNARGNSSGGEVAARAVRRGEAGFTLIELAVATIVLLLAVLLACDLLAESGRMLHHSVRRARDPYPLLAAELLRNDLRAARPPGVIDPGFTHTELVLSIGADTVVWKRSGDSYLTRVADGIERAYIQEVRRFRWRPLGSSFEVWVEYDTSSPYLRQLAGSLPRSDPGQSADLHLVVVARGGGAYQW